MLLNNHSYIMTFLKSRLNMILTHQLICLDLFTGLKKILKIYRANIMTVVEQKPLRFRINNTRDQPNKN